MPFCRAKSRCFIVFCVAAALLFERCNALPRTIRIGGLFETEDDEQAMAFRIATDRINSDPELLPKSRLIAKVERIQPGDGFIATKKVCDFLKVGVAAVFGPQTATTSMHVGSMCDELEVPHVETRWDPVGQRDDLSINLHPSPTVLSGSYIALVKHLGWQNFTLLYEEHDGIFRFRNFLKEADVNKWNVRIHRFQPGEPYRNVFWEIKKEQLKTQMRDGHSKYPFGQSTGVKIVLDVPRKHLHTVLKHAQQVGMVTENQQYLITNLDLNTLDLEDFKYSKTNITGFRLVQEANPEYQMLLQEISSRQGQDRQIFALKAETALIYDAVQMFARALQGLDTGKDIEEFPAISCNSTSATKGTDGTSLINYMKSGMMNGITGVLTFDGQGFRSLFKLDIVHMTEDGLVEIGALLPGQRVNITRNITTESHFERREYTITTIVGPPYLTLKNSSRDLKGNDRYEGFCVDLLDELSKILHFSYKIKLVSDERYGNEDKNVKGKWNGMIGEVMNDVADMAIADLSINSIRERVVDFSMPFMNTGISILFKKPTTTVKSLFSFLSPFSGEVWCYLMATFFGVSIVTFLVGRLTPYEWINPHPCRQDDIVVENTFNVRNSMWLVTGSLMQQGSDLIPTAFCTRTAMSFWNFFTLIIVSSYTANLAAFLTVEKVVYPIEGANDLVKQNWHPKISYGCLEGGSTCSFFENSNISTFKEMGHAISQDPSAKVKSNERGKRKVYEDNYAYLMESATIKYITERECQLTQIGGLLDNKGYGIAVKKGNRELASYLSSGILQLQEAGTIHTLKERWWSQKGGGKCGDSGKQSGKASELSLRNVGGVFVVLILGLTGAMIVALVEYWWKSRQYQSYGEISFWKMLIEELKFALSCENTTKPVPKLKPRLSVKRGSSPEGSNNSRFTPPSQANNSGVD